MYSLLDEEKINNMRNKYLSFKKNVRKFTETHQVELILTIVGFVIINFLRSIPYINLIISNGLGYLLAIVITLIIFKVNMRNIVILISVTFFLDVVTNSIGDLEVAEQLGNMIYIFLVIAFIQFIYKIRKGIV